MAHDYGIENGVLVKGELILVEHRYALSRPFANLAPIWHKLPCQYLQKSGFASAVRPYKAVAVSRDKFDINVLEDDLLTIGESYIGCGYHNSVLIKY
jgi:hypothetical protein